MELHYQQLKDLQRKLRDQDGFPQSLALRTHRSLSWLNRAEKEEDDVDVRFILLWIAFNAAYAHEVNSASPFSEKRIFLSFLQRLIKTDRNNLLYDTIWKEFSGAIRLLINNKFIFQPFWDFHNGKNNEESWIASFEHSKKRVNNAIAKQQTIKILSVVFDRLYVLRNQMIHGGATWNSSINRDQVRDGANIMGKLVPSIIFIMMDNPKQHWSEPCYPVVK